MEFTEGQTSFPAYRFASRETVWQDEQIAYKDIPYFALYHVHFFAQIFEGKIRMCITHG